MVNKGKGNFGERLAARYLAHKGYKISQRNWYCRWGEIDIIADLKDVIVFVEVKYRTADIYGAGNQSIRHRKIRSLRRSIIRYLSLNNLFHKKCRLDVISIDKNRGKYKLSHYRSVIF